MSNSKTSNNEQIKLYLQNMIEEIKFEKLPPLWNDFDLDMFSKEKVLWDYQRKALENAIKVLWKFYEEFVDYKDEEKLSANLERKEKLYRWYKDNHLNIDLDIRLDNKNSRILKILNDYYPMEEGRISYKHFINRMSFWMATGSGKSLVIIKLIEILNELIKRKEIPPYDILFLTHRDDLIEQFKRHVEEYNKTHLTKIILKDLREYSDVKRYLNLFGVVVFYYRSDLFSDEHGEKIIDFREYYNNGKWYIILDEAHKGDKEESKRQHIFSILSQNGFLFNFSATFTDPRDIITCAYEFNLSTFIKRGYGKHICLLKQEIRAFRDNEDYTEEEKQKIVLKSLILFTFVRKFYEEIKKVDFSLYHRPLILTLVNSVNTEDADLKLFFREIEKIGKGELEDKVFEQAKEELLNEFQEGLEFMFEDSRLAIDKKIFSEISKKDVLKLVYNTSSFGEIEVIKNRSNNQELAFKLKTSDKPFALIKIGNISEWLKELIGYEIQESLRDESFFKELNSENSEINLLMGSRGFYEGWDSNRPNIINFINIGTGKEAKKFILQSIGRGIRIEPIRNKRKRLLELYNAGEVDEGLFRLVKDKVELLETLFIFATNRKVLSAVIQELNKERARKSERILSLRVNSNAEKFPQLIPVYRVVESLNFENRQRFRLSREDFELFAKFIDYIEDDRIFLMRYDVDPLKVCLLRERRGIGLAEGSGDTVKILRNIDLIFQRYFQYLNLQEEELDRIKKLEDEIRHFKSIKVYLEDISELNNLANKVKKVSEYQFIIEKSVKELQEKFNYGKITLDQYTEEIKRIIQQNPREERFEKGNSGKLIIKHVAEHYYIPIILSENEKIDYIKHIVKVESEVDFVKKLEEYLGKDDNGFRRFDWWMFSKIDENLDEVYIPYYNPNANKISKFKPDFIFWLMKGDDYYIVFVDPKGTEYVDAERKIDGFEKIFQENGKSKVFEYESLKVRVKLLYRTEDKTKVTEKYKIYWFKDIDEMLEAIQKSEL